jgi:hypothetical protein
MVRDDCTKRLDELENAQPTIAFEVKDASGADLVDVRVTVDGQRLVDRLDGKPVNVDPGAHVFAFEVAGQRPVGRTLVLTEGQKGRRESVVLSSSKPTGSQATHAPTPTPTEGGSLPTAAYVSLAVGGAGLIAGSIFAVLAAGAKSDADSKCPNGPSLCPADVNVSQLNDRITTNSIGAGIGFAIAAVGGGVGAILLLTSGSRSTPARGMRIEPRVGVGWMGIEVGGRF